jgi:AbrB family looped-hinge helix DNA binding protein
MTKTTISREGQIVILEAVRERLKLRAGTQLSIDMQGEAFVIKPLVEISPDWRTMRGMARGGESLTQALMEERAAELAHDEARSKGH